MTSHTDYICKASPLQLVKLRYADICKCLSLLTCMGPCMSLQIKSIVESLATECTEIPLGVTVALHVSVEQSLKTECFATHSAGKLAGG